MKTKIIALPTEEGPVYVAEGKWHNCLTSMHIPTGNQQPHHLYMITPDAKIRRDDWLFSAYTNRILQADDSESRWRDANYAKVIQSTDSSLGLDFIGEGVCREFCEIENRNKV